jgi:glycosyltransferase involved in cell wall biosynthesis
MRKKRILYLSDYAGAFTGFGKNTKLLLSYLYKTGKYEILNAAQGVPKHGPHEYKYPWKTIGVLPNDPNKINQINQDPNLGRMAAYGSLEITDIVKEFKPDVIFSVNDTWGSQFVINEPFFDKIPTICWNTFDSLPLLPDTIENAKKIQYYWTWSDFARKELHKLGFDKVKNQYPLVNTNNFYKLSDEKIAEIKNRFGIPQDAFIIGFVFRNQLRKLINTQIEAYALFKKHNPEIKNTFLYTHTHYGEGWDIHRLCQQYGVDPREVLCTYVCKETRQYFIAPFHGQDIENPITKRKTVVTANVGLGVTDEQLNEIYNIFSLYSHPATSGACELPCVEAALTEKIITTCEYSFGEDIIENNKGSIPMKFTFYTEHGTQFLKSQPSPYELSKIFKKVYEMKPQLKRKMEQDSRNWALENYSIEVNGKKIEEFIDKNLSLLNEDDFIFSNKNEKKQNPNAIIENNSDNKTWVKSLYKQILDMEVSDQDEGLRHWLQKLEQNTPKEQIENYFRQVAQQELSKSQEKPLELQDLFKEDQNFKKVLIIQPESIGDIFLLTSVFESIRERYPSNKYKIYISTKPEYKDIIDGNPFIDKWVPYHPAMDNIIIMEGGMGQKGLCDIVYYPYFATQRLLSYMHNGEDKIDLELQ